MVAAGWRLCASWVLAACLTACGGGGGGGAGAGDGGVSAPASVIPAASAPGAILVADAATLRPLIDGANWRYDGTLRNYKGSTSYANTVSLAAGGSGFSETTSNAFNDGADTATVSILAGTVTGAAVVELVPGRPQTISYPELRSPVRQDDQVTVLEQRVADLGSDIDGDGKNEAGDIGIYRLVVGMEDVSLPTGPTQRAVRVDMVGLVRITLSKDGTLLPVVRSVVQSTWYAPGIGIVKQRLTTPVTASTDEVAEEVLSYFDGVTRGFGAKPAVEMRVPADSPLYAGKALWGVRQVVALPDHAVIVSEVEGASGELVLSSMDLNGKVTRSSIYGIEYPARASTLVVVGGQLIAATLPQDIISRNCQFDLLHFSAHGADYSANANSTVVVPPAAGKPYCNRIDSLNSAGDGNRLWMAMVRYSLSSDGWVTDLLVQPFNAQGVAQSAAMTVHSRVGLQTSVEVQAIAASGGRAVVAYLNGVDDNIHLAAVSDAGIQNQASLALNWAKGSSRLRLFAAGDRTALFWQPRTTTTLWSAPRGVLLDQSLAPMLASGNLDLNAQTHSSWDANCGSCMPIMDAGGDKLWMVSGSTSTAEPWRVGYAMLSMRGDALATQVFTPVMQAFGPEFSGGAGAPEAAGFAQNSGRLILVAGNGRGLYSKVAWLP